MKIENLEILEIVKNNTLPNSTKTSLLRNWVYRNAAYNPNGGEVNDYLANNAPALNIDDVFAICLQKGVTCGGFAELLRRLYMELGYFSCVISFGKPGTPYTHSATLVLILDDGDDRVILQDPTFNMTFMDSHGHIPSVNNLFQDSLSQKGCPYYRVYDTGIVGKNKTINPEAFYKHPYYPLIREDGEYKVVLTFEGYNMAVSTQAKAEGLHYEDVYFDPVETFWYFGLDAIPSLYRDNYFQSIPVTEGNTFNTTTP
jgi:hypothetical protein